MSPSRRGSSRRSTFRDHLPERVQRLVIGSVHAASWEPARTFAQRAAERLERTEHRDGIADVDAVLTEAAKAGRAAAGPGTLEAARRAAIHRLSILENLRRPGYQCERCGALQEARVRCRLCGGPARDRLATALVDRVVTTGGTVEIVVDHAGLEAAGGLAARLRYPLSSFRPA